MTPDEVATHLHVPLRDVHRLIDRGILPTRDVGSNRRIDAASVLAYQAQRNEGRRALAVTFGSAEDDRETLIAELTDGHAGPRSVI
jgi:excisionase family DNA binding protein